MVPLMAPDSRMRKCKSPGYHFFLRTRFFLVVVAAHSPGPFPSQQS